MDGTEVTRVIHGVKVHFPCKPYPSQMSMMEKIIKGIERRQNCLLESPTGSGKSLSLLCSALAWQCAEHDKARTEDDERNNSDCHACTCGANRSDTEVGNPAPNLPVPPRSADTSTSRHFPVTNEKTPANDSKTIIIIDDDADDFKDFKGKKLKSILPQNGIIRNVTSGVQTIQPHPPTHQVMMAITPGPQAIKLHLTTDQVLIPITSDSQTTKPSLTTGEIVMPGASNVSTLPAQWSTGLIMLPGTVKTIQSQLSTGQVIIPGMASPPGIQTITPQLSTGQIMMTSPTDVTKPTNKQCTCSFKGTKDTASAQIRKVPKIYFGTRTHKQIEQIIRELRKTAYRDVKMTILASREHTCVHPGVSKSSSKNEGCKELLDGPGCMFHTNVRKVASQHALKYEHGVDVAWDIEDLVKLCTTKRVKACPYFVSRELRADADIIFCPYNYLVDPIIRKAMEINLKGQIVILDEAHNIEDAAREAVSKTIPQDQLVKTIKELYELTAIPIKPKEHTVLRNVAESVDNFISSSASLLEQHDFEQATKVWAGMDVVARLENLKLGPKYLPELEKCLAAVCEDDTDGTKSHKSVPRLSTPSIQLFEYLFTMLDYLYRQDMKFVNDYRVAIVRSTIYGSGPDTNSSWLTSRKGRGRREMRQLLSLNFWCLNPGVAFSDFGIVRSIVLTSGTLSPMNSFQSELGMPFPIVLEANHIITDSQVFVGAIGQGPNFGALQATYRNTETYTFQDELGKLLLQICKRVPKGVLCFLPSYKMLDKLSMRWKTTGLWDELLAQKRVVSEPRASERVDFDELLKYFYRTVDGSSGNGSASCEDSDEENMCPVDGSLFLAVCRGKVSEGLDFADNNARAVITVGIPYPNFKDIQVELKRKYNDFYCRERGLLSGSEWYEIQAFRALNQALGRCIRHRNDWGALILIDDRFVKTPQKYIRGLSKWVRNRAQTFATCNQALDALTRFTKSRIEQTDGEASRLTIPTTPASKLADESSINNDVTQTPHCDSVIKTPLHDVNSKSNVSVISNNKSMLLSSTPLLSSIKSEISTFPKLSPVKDLANSSDVLETPKGKLDLRSVNRSGLKSHPPISACVLEPQVVVKSEYMPDIQPALSTMPEDMAQIHPVMVIKSEPGLEPQPAMSTKEKLFRTLYYGNTDSPVSNDASHSDKISEASTLTKRAGKLGSCTLSVLSKTEHGQIEAVFQRKTQKELRSKVTSLIDNNMANDMVKDSGDRTDLPDDKEAHVGMTVKAVIPVTFSGDGARGLTCDTNNFCDKNKHCNNNNSSINNNNDVIDDGAGHVTCDGDQDARDQLSCSPALFDFDISEHESEDFKPSNISYRMKPSRSRKKDTRHQKYNKLEYVSQNDVKTENDECKSVWKKKPLFRRLSLKSVQEKEPDTVDGDESDGFIHGDQKLGDDDCVDDEDVSLKHPGRGEKRRAGTRTRHVNKRYKGGDFVTDESDIVTSKRKSTNRDKSFSGLRCYSCGKILLKDMQDARKMQLPAILLLPLLGINRCQVYPHHSTELADHLKPITHHHNGSTLNSHWNEAAGACIQYLQCVCHSKNGQTDTIVALKVICTAEKSHFTAGQMWYLAEAVNTGSSTTNDT